MPDREPPDHPSPTGLCKSCRLPIDPKATVCPHCHSDHRPLSFWRRASVYIPVLSFAVAILSLLPGVFDAVERMLYPPAAKVQVVGIKSIKSGLAITVVNLGNASGVLNSDLTCVSSGVTPKFSLRYSGDTHAVIKPGDTGLIPYGSGIQMTVPGVQIETMIGEDQELAFLYVQAVGGLRQSGFSGSMPDALELTCEVPIAGQATWLTKPTFILSLSDGAVSIDFNYDLTP